MRGVHELKTSEKAIVITIIFSVIGVLGIFFNYDIPDEHIALLIKIIFALFILMATWKILDLFIFNDKNKEKEVNKNEKKK